MVSVVCRIAVPYDQLSPSILEARRGASAVEVVCFLWYLLTVKS